MLGPKILRGPDYEESVEKQAVMTFVRNVRLSNNPAVRMEPKFPTEPRTRLNVFEHTCQYFSSTLKSPKMRIQVESEKIKEKELETIKTFRELMEIQS